MGYKRGIRKGDPNGVPRGGTKGDQKKLRCKKGKPLGNTYVLMNSVSNTPCY